MSDGLTVLKPLAVTEAMLLATDVDENDYAAWNVATAYVVGDRVILSHSVYECFQAHTGKDPSVAANAAYWGRVSPTNRWKLFDLKHSSRTARASSLYYRLKPGAAISAVSARSLVGCNQVRVRLTDPAYGLVYDQTRDTSPIPPASDWWDWFFGAWDDRQAAYFDDLPAFPNAELRVDFSGTSDLAVGALLFGQARGWGLGAKFGLRLGIQDYSRKETNTWGDLELREGAYADRMSFTLALPNDQIDAAKAFLTSLRAQPALYVVSQQLGQQYEALSVLGIYKDFDVLVPYPKESDVEFTLLGTT